MHEEEVEVVKFHAFEASIKADLHIFRRSKLRPEFRSDENFKTGNARVVDSSTDSFIDLSGFGSALLGSRREYVRRSPKHSLCDDSQL